MQISDLIGKYINNTPTNNVTLENAPNINSVNKLVAAIRELTIGNIFEGVVQHVKNGQASIGLPDGKVISAKLDSNIQLKPGQTMFFQVKSNNGKQVEIRPFTLEGSEGNPTLMKALEAANLPVEAKYLSMVNKMMEEQMPIDKNSVMQMAKLLQENPDINEGTLVQLKKLELPISPEIASQFENYANDKQAILAVLEDYIEEIPQLMSEQTLPFPKLQKMNADLLSVFANDLPDETIVLSNLFSENELSNISRQLQPLLPEEVFQITEEGDFVLKDTTIKQLLTSVGEAVLEAPPELRETVIKLFEGKEFKALVQESVEQQWLLNPKELVKDKAVSKLYEKIEQQLDKIQEIVKTTEHSNKTIDHLSANIKANVEFMNQVNQMYSFVQVPLNMSGQNANGELYVYTKNHHNGEGKEELSAFLHLDMENLGSTDVSVRMKGKEVKTNFYFDNDETFELVKAHLPILNKRLEKKGYNCKLEVINENKKIDFVEDFLKQDMPSSAVLHRYSFDVRA